MHHKLQLVVIRKLLRKEREEGFSLIELVVVVSVLAVLAAIAMPSFTCFPKKAKATAALAALRQIQKEDVSSLYTLKYYIVLSYKYDMQIEREDLSS